MSQSKIKSLQAIIKDNKTQIRLRLDDGMEFFRDMTPHSLNSASVCVETLKRDSAIHGESEIFNFFQI